MDIKSLVAVSRHRLASDSHEFRVVETVAAILEPSPLKPFKTGLGLARQTNKEIAVPLAMQLVGRQDVAGRTSTRGASK